MQKHSSFRGFGLISIVALAVCGLPSPAHSQQSTSPAVDDANRELREIRSPDIYFVPTPQPVVDKMLELAKVTRDDVVYDLGCGDGRIVITAAKKYGCRGVGYDIDPKRVMESINNVREQGVMKLVRIEQKDVFTLDLSQASVITLYLLPSLNVKLIPQLLKVKPGTRIVSHDFDMQGKVIQDKAVRVRTEDDMEHTVYLWTAPLKVNEKEN
jgi:SAM-dependent methyltransferase